MFVMFRKAALNTSKETSIIYWNRFDEVFDKYREVITGDY